MSDAVEIRKVDKRGDWTLFQQLAVLHIDLIHGGILPLLGPDFLATLYAEIAASSTGCVEVAIHRQKVIGFVAGSWDIWRCAFGFSIGGFARLGLILLQRLTNRPVLRKARDTFLYPFRQPSGETNQKQPRHRAELLAIAVTEEGQGQGVGRKLVATLEDFLRPHVGHYFVTTDVSAVQSNAFYQALGFRRAGCKKHHDLLLQTYVKYL